MLQRGFSIMTAVFLVVVLGLLGVFIVYVTGLQQGGQQIDLLGVRAYQAARAGIEWGAFQVLDPNNALNPVPPGTCTNTVTCPGGGASSTTPLPALAGSLATFSVTVICNMTSTTEGNREIRVFAITSTATTGTPSTPGYVNRQVSATLSKCLDPTAAAPRCACS